MLILNRCEFSILCKRWAFDDASEPCKRKQLAPIFVSHSLNDVYAWTWNLKLEEMIEYISVGVTAAQYWKDSVALS